MIESMQEILGSVLKSLDIIYIIEGIKPASRIMVDEASYIPITTFLKKKNLAFERSDFKVAKSDNGAYSDKGAIIPKDSKGGYFFLYISKSQQLAKKAKELEAQNNHKGLGIALGYPECCSEFFEKHFPIESKKANDYTMASLANSEGYTFPFYTNIAVRHMDLALLSHFPCNFKCKSSIAQAKKNLECIERHSSDFGLIFRNMLKSAAIYSKEGIFLLRDLKLEGNKLFYNNVISNVNNSTLSELKKHAFINITDKHNIQIGAISLDNIGFILFK